MRQIDGRKDGQIFPIDLVDEFILGVNQSLHELAIDCDFLEGDSIYVNIYNGDIPRLTSYNEDFAYDVASHIEDILNRNKSDGKRWTLDGAPNYWAKAIDGSNDEVDDIEDATTIQWMIYERKI